MSTSGSGLPSRQPGLVGRMRIVVGQAWENKGRVGCGLVVAFLGYLVLRGCVPGLSGNHLPPEVESAVAEVYAHCDQDFPIWPGEVRMPTCDLVGTRVMGRGRLTPDSERVGIERAICYRVEIEQLFWGESGSWKHEMAWSVRTVSKVTILQNGTWVLYPDQDSADAARWAEYGCPGPYESSSRLVPRRS